MIDDQGFKFGYGVQSVIGTAVTCTGGLRVRKEGSVPDFLPNAAHVEIPLHDGNRFQSDYNQVAGIERPGTTLPMAGDITTIDLLLEQVMDSSGVGDVTYALKTGTSANPTSDAYLTLFRRNTRASSEDKRLTASVLKSLKFSSSESQQELRLDAEMLATVLTTGHDASAGTFTLPSDSILLHKNLTFELDTVATKLLEWELTLDFGIVGYIDNGTEISEFILGIMGAEGSFSAPWASSAQLDDFRASTASVLEFIWGSAGSGGHCHITLPVKYKEATEEGSDGRMMDKLPFDLRDTSSSALTIVTNNT